MQKEDLRKKAWKEFQKVASAETANGCETLAYRRLVPQFSTAPQGETQDMLLMMGCWSRIGHGEWIIETGRELYVWARENGYEGVESPSPP